MDLFDALEVGDTIVYSDREEFLIGVLTRGSRVINFYVPALTQPLDWIADDTMTIGGSKEGPASVTEAIMHAAEFVADEG